ncbi:hypothetical protein PV327_011443, partial [Microctonus hyperodae]
IPKSTEGKPWYYYMDKSITEDMLNKMVDEFLDVYGRCNQSGLKRHIAFLQPANPSPQTSDSGYKSPNDEVVRNIRMKLWNLQYGHIAFGYMFMPHYLGSEWDRASALLGVDVVSANRIHLFYPIPSLTSSWWTPVT